MSAGMTLDVRDFSRDLEKLNWGDRKPAVVKAMKKSVEPIRETASQLAPRLTGRLSQSMVIEEDKKDSDVNSVTVLIGPTKAAWYGMFVEHGTRHSSAHPFLQPAVEQTINEVEHLLAENLSEEIEKALH